MTVGKSGFPLAEKLSLKLPHLVHMMIYGPISSDTDCKGNRIVVLFTGLVAFLPLASVHWLSLSRNTSRNSQIITGLQNSAIRDPYLNSSNSNCTLFQLKASKTSSQNKAFSLLDLFFRYEPSDNSQSILALIQKSKELKSKVSLYRTGDMVHAA